MIPVWPKINYYAEKGSWTLAPSNGSSKTGSDMDSGRTRGRRRFTTTLSAVAFSASLTDIETELYNFFYDEVLLDGTKWFIMPIFDGTSYKPHMVRFPLDFSPQITNIGFRRNMLSLQLEVSSLYEISEAAYAFYSAYGFDTGGKLIDALHTFKNVNWPNITELL